LTQNTIVITLTLRINYFFPRHNIEVGGSEVI